MYDVKPEVNTLLKSIPGVTVSDAYPSDFSMMPHISFYELTNKDALEISTEPLTDITVQIDVWHKRSTGGLAQQVNEKMNSIGFRRQMSNDVLDSSGIKRKTMRFGARIDNRTLRVHQP